MVWLIVLASLLLNGVALARPMEAAAAPRLEWLPVPADEMTSGPDGNVWFTTGQPDGPYAIGRINPQGKIARYPLNLPQAVLVARGPDRTLWVTYDGGVARVTTKGQVTPIPIPGASFAALTLGPDGNMWATQPNGDQGAGIWRITPSGAATFFSAGFFYGAMEGVAAGADGNVWFTEGVPVPDQFPTLAGRIGRVTPQGAITVFPLPGVVVPEGIVSGADGNLWFTGGSALGRLTTQGQITLLSPLAASPPITAGPDGNIWFVTGEPQQQLAYITPGGTEHVVHTPPIYNAVSMTCGADGNLWLLAQNTVTQSQSVGRLSGFKGAVGTPGCPATPPTPRPKPQPTSGIQLLPLFVGATVGKDETDTVALMSFPTVHHKAAPSSDFHVRLRWGDGSSSAGEAKKVSLSLLASLFPHRTLYLVQGTHRYRSTKPSRIDITISRRGVATVQNRARLVVNRPDPTAYFFSTPDTPHQAETALHGLDTNTIASVVPAMPGPLQRPIREFRWEFLDGKPVVDNAKTRPEYMRLLTKLRNSPSDNDLKQEAIDKGILPENAKSGPLGIGGLSTDEVRQIVRDWQTEFPAHVVPHAYPFSGQVEVKLTVTDSAGKKDQSARTLTVSQECMQWGGNGLFGWNPFAGYTTCDTGAGFESEIGPHRAPDYAVISLAKGFKLPQIARPLAGLGAAQIYILRGVLDGAPNSVLLGAQLSVGVKLASSAAVGFGWVGPPDPAHQPSDDAISRFVNGFTIPAGLTAGIHAGPVSLGGGLNFIYSPSQHQGGVETAGEGITGLGFQVGGACAAPLTVVGPGAADFLKRLYQTWNTAPPKPNPTIVGADLEQLARLLAGSVSDIGRTVRDAAAYCAR